MSLIQEISRTETEKNKTKQVATQIDNKLVELGGEQAENLSDVANKMEGMVTGNYKKVAFGTFNDSLSGSNIYGSDRVFEETKSIPLNLNFTPEVVYLSVKTVGFDVDSCKNVSISSKKNYDSNSSVGEPNYTYNAGRVYIKSISKEKIDLNFILLESQNSFVARKTLIVQGPIDWIAIG